MTNREKLVEAARLVGEVTRTLNVQIEECGHCGFHKRANFTDYRISLEMDAVIRKLMKWIGLLDTGDWKPGVGTLQTPIFPEDSSEKSQLSEHTRARLQKVLADGLDNPEA